MRMNHVVISTLALSLSGFVAPVTSAQPMGSLAAGFVQEAPWDQPPPGFRDAQVKGFHDGIEGARKDFDNHRAPNPENRDEFRHPKIEASLRADYRDGFRRGYETAMQHMMAERDRNRH